MVLPAGVYEKHLSYVGLEVPAEFSRNVASVECPDVESGKSQIHERGYLRRDTDIERVRVGVVVLSRLEFADVVVQVYTAVNVAGIYRKAEVRFDVVKSVVVGVHYSAAYDRGLRVADRYRHSLYELVKCRYAEHFVDHQRRRIHNEVCIMAEQRAASFAAVLRVYRMSQLTGAVTPRSIRNRRKGIFHIHSVIVRKNGG